MALGAALAVRLGIAVKPQEYSWVQMIGAGALAGIGFTMSLFISQLAFGAAGLVEEAKLGILLGSALSAVIGLVWLYMAGSHSH
jgi:NhaA family Na+:H+ antiporter